MHMPEKYEPIEWATIERTHICPKDEEKEEADLAPDQDADAAVVEADKLNQPQHQPKN